MKQYTILAIGLSVVALLWALLIITDVDKVRSSELAPYLLAYTGIMLAFCVAAFAYIKKMERRRLTRRRR